MFRPFPVLLCLVCWLQLSGQYYFENITSSQGLSDNRVTCFFQDRDGFMWIGTANGLNRYDGYRFRIYKPGNSQYALSHEYITDIEQDQSGRMWVATLGGLNVLNVQKDSLRIFTPDDGWYGDTARVIRSILIYDLYADKQGRIWMALDNRDLCYYDLNNNRFHYFPFKQFLVSQLPERANRYNSICRIVPKSADELWLATNCGIMVFNTRTAKFTYLGGQLNEWVPYCNFDVLSGKFFFWQDNGQPMVIEPGTAHARALPRWKVSPFYVTDKRFKCWFPWNEMLLQIDPVLEQFQQVYYEQSQPNTLLHGKKNAVYTDRRGITWIGTENGISRFDPGLNDFTIIRIMPGNVPKGQGIRQMLYSGYDNSYYVVAGPPNGKEDYTSPLIRIGADDHNITYLHSINDMALSPLVSLYEEQHRLWLVEKKGIVCWNRQTGETTRLRLPSAVESVTCITRDADGNYWIGTYGNYVYRYNVARREWRQFTTANGFLGRLVNKIIPDPVKRVVWIGSEGGGLYAFDLDKERFTFHNQDVKNADSMHSTIINDLASSPGGEIWIATRNGGLSLFPAKASKGFTTFSLQDGLAENTVHSLCLDAAGNCWFTNYKGLGRIAGNDHSISMQYSILNLPASTSKAGLLFNPKGELVIGGETSLLIVRPGDRPAPASPFSIKLINASANSTALPVEEHNMPALDYRQNELRFDFAALNYSMPDKLVYRYMLEGYDNDWKQTSAPSVSYTNLGGGDYTFKLQATDQSGLRSLNHISYSFSILPPFWQRWWFAALLLTALAAAIFFWISSLREKIRSEKILNHFATSLYSRNTVEDIFRDVAQHCVTHLRFASCVIYQYDPQTGRPLQKAASGHAVQPPKLSRAVTVPVLVDGKAFAVIEAAHPAKKYYRRKPLRLLHKIADICGTKISRCLVEENLRTKIARDLHDEMGSTLTSISIISKMALQQSLNNADVSTNLQKIKDHSGKMMESMNDIVWAINPANDSLEKIILRMKEFAAELLEPARINFVFKEEGRLDDVKLNLEQRKELYLIFKEALNNAVKYSGASEMVIALERSNGRLAMQVADNGKGFDARSVHAGNGLRNMHNRAALMHAVLHIQSMPAAGTTVSIEVPV